MAIEYRFLVTRPRCRLLRHVSELHSIRQGKGDGVSRTLYREFVLRGPSVWALLVAFVKANAEACIKRNKPLRVIVTEEDRKRSTEANARYWKLLSIIAENAWVDGRKFDKEVWHEMFARMYLPLEEMVLPDGEIIQRRQTTTALKVGAFSEYMQQVEAYASMELGVEFLE